MLLRVQIQVILFHLLAGWVYGFGFSFVQVLTQTRRFYPVTLLCEAGYHALFAAAMFFALLPLNGAITNIYLILCFVLGAFVYYRFYFALFHRWFSVVRHFLHRIFHKIAVAKSAVLGIIKKNTPKRKKRRDRRGSKKKKNVDNTG